jgi:diguanylate cyclase (GGDEF)-like protein
MRTEEIHKQLQSFDRDSLRLWAAAMLTMCAVALGFVWLVLPTILLHAGSFKTQLWRRPQGFFGAVALILLFNIYMLQRRKALHRARDEMIRELVRVEAEEMLSLLDPVTELFNRRFLDRILPREISHADRNDSPLTIALLDIVGFKSANQRVGEFAGDGILVEVARLLARTFRPADLVIRYGGDEFLVLMPGTDEPSAGRAIERLMKRVEIWNRENARKEFRLQFNVGTAAYSRGTEIATLLAAAEHQLYLSRLQGSADAGTPVPSEIAGKA